MATPSSVASASRRRSTNIFRALLGVVLLTVVLIAGFAIWVVLAGRGALPQLDGSLKVEGLSAPVSVVRNAQGVPAISAATLEDLFFAQGFVTAQDRLWQMDMLRRSASGRLSEVLGSSLLKHDIQQRTILMPVIAERAAATLNPRDRSYMEAYARGVNTFIEQHRNHLPLEFRVLNYEPQPWTVVDSMLVGASMSEMLNLADLEDVLNREKIIARLGPELAADLYPNSSFRDQPPSASSDEESLSEGDASASEEESEQPQPRRNLPRARRRPRTGSTALDGPRQRRSARHQGRHAGLDPFVLPQMDAAPLVPGSNNWVVSGTHTASGKPLLSNDMHLPHQMPNLWYEVHLTSGSFDVAGVSLPGVPFVIVGQNQRIAWGFTNVGPAVTELYVETFNQQGQYQAPDGWKEPEHRTELIGVRWGRDRKIDVLVTRHGPIVSDLVKGEQRKLALKWVAYDPAGMHEPFFDVDSAQNWDEFRRAFSRFGSPGQNVVYADIDGHIGYQTTGLVPIRPVSFQVAAPSTADPDNQSGTETSKPAIDATVLDQEHSLLTGTPVPGSDGSHEWLGYVPFDKLPSVYDPPSGVIGTANGRITPDGYPFMVANEWGSAYRTERIYRYLSADKKFSPADMLALQTDIYSEFDRFCAQRFAYAVDHSPQSSPRARQAAEIMRTWDGRIATRSAAPSIVAAARRELSQLLLEPKLESMAKDYRWFMSSVWLENVLLLQPARWLPSGYSSYDALLAAAVDRGLKDAPRDLSGWKWGKRSQVAIAHPLFGSIPILSRFAGPGEHEQSGNGFTVKQVGNRFGPSERFTADFSNFDNSTLNTVTGQSGNLFSPHYMDQWSAWYQGSTFQLPFSKEAVERDGKHRLTLQPN